MYETLGDEADEDLDGFFSLAGVAAGVGFCSAGGLGVFVADAASGGTMFGGGGMNGGGGSMGNGMGPCGTKPKPGCGMTMECG
jgi:hypothetical protein